MVALILFGWISYSHMGISNLPDVDFPVVGVSLSLNGAAPEIMESQVVDPIEDAIMQIQGIRSVTSSSQQSSASIAVEFEINRNIDEAVQEVQNRIKQVQNLLPKDLFPPTVRKTNPEDQPIMWLAVTADGSTSLMDLMIYSRNVLFDKFATVKGVGDIALGGYVDPALRVWVDNDKLKKYELTSADVVNSVLNEQIEVPAGRIEAPHKEYNVRLEGEASTAKDFGNIEINKRIIGQVNHRLIPLSKIAIVEEGTIDVRRISRSNGQLAVGLGILKQHGSNAVEVAKNIRERLKEIQPLIPKAYKVTIRSDQTRFIRQSVNELYFTLILSALLTSFVCYLFLGSWTSTINVLLAIPTSIIGTFIALYFFGFTFNTFTLLGLSLAIGIVVDDAIMMLENIVRHRELGEKRKAAALKGADEIKFAAVAATVAVCAIFLPVIFMKGVIGRYFFQYGITVTVAVLLSLLEALTLTPMRCSRFLVVTKESDKGKGLHAFVDRTFRKLAEKYKVILNILLEHRWKTLFIALGLFVASLVVAKFLPSEMIPAQDQSVFMLRLKGPVGSSLSVTDDKSKLAEQYTLKQPEVDGYFSTVGGFGGDSVNQGMIVVMLKDIDKRKASQKDVMARFRKDLKPMLKPMQVIVQDPSTRGFSASRGFPVEFTIQGANWDKLSEYTNQMIDELNKTGAVTDVNTDVQGGMPEYQIIPNRDKLAAFGVSLKTVTTTLNTLIGGSILNGPIEYPKNGRRYEIEIRLKAQQRDKYEQLKTIQVANNRGELTVLSNLVDIVEKPSLMLISRLNRTRAIAVYGNVASGHSQQEALDIVEKLGKRILPPGYYAKLTGSSQSYKESFESLIFALLLGILVSYMVLASQFNSFIHPIVILMALPFSFSGAFVALAVAHQSINIYSIIGFILLMGIVKKNSILLVDFTNQLRREGKDVKSALLGACPVRMRPIIMTSVATMAGALPVALSIGPGAETRIPMSVVIIGGVLISTLLTLFVVPCVYSVMTSLERSDHRK